MGNGFPHDPCRAQRDCRYRFCKKSILYSALRHTHDRRMVSFRSVDTQPRGRLSLTRVSRWLERTHAIVRDRMNGIPSSFKCTDRELYTDTARKSKNIRLATNTSGLRLLKS